jgi:hypothetical protein
MVERCICCVRVLEQQNTHEIHSSTESRMTENRPALLYRTDYVAITINKTVSNVRLGPLSLRVHLIKGDPRVQPLVALHLYYLPLLSGIEGFLEGAHIGLLEQRLPDLAFASEDIIQLLHKKSTSEMLM